jgi:nucleotide-binding universal stress UspA family protein
MNPSPSGNLDHQEVGPLRRQNMTKEEKVFNRNILIAVDESENARRAVSYVGQFLGGLTGFKVTILHVIPEPEEDYFPTSAQKERWFIRYKKKVDTMLEDYRELLIQKGFNPKDVAVHSTVRYCPSMAECILAERDETLYSTIVVGRQGLSRSEEFLFGSISSKIVTHARNCTVWVVE